MTDARRGEIAFLVLKQRSMKEGIRLMPDFKRNLANDAKELGISFEEMMEFVESIVREAVDNAFGKSKK